MADVEEKLVLQKFVVGLGEKEVLRPLFLNPVACGFESPAEEYVEKDLDLDSYVKASNSSVFYVKAQGRSMIDANIAENDLLVVDKAKEAKNGDVIIAYINGGFLIKKFYKKNNQIYLVPCNLSEAKYKTKKVLPDDDFLVWGVVTHVVHSF